MSIIDSSAASSVPTPVGPLQFWFELASSYSYVAAMRIEAAARAAGVPLVWEPFLLGPIFKDRGLSDSPFNLDPLRGKQMWRDLERLCAKHGLPFQRPSVFPRNSVLASRVACLGAGEPWGPAFVRAAYVANFGQDRDIADATTLAGLLDGLGQPGGELVARAQSPEQKQLLRTQTERARALGIFGAPDFVTAKGELFFGQDRLDDALAWARKEQP